MRCWYDDGWGRLGVPGVSLLRLIGKRLALGAVAAWTVLTAVFALFTLTEDWVLQGRLGALRYGGASEQEIREAREAYLARRGLDQSRWQQYVDYVGDMATLDWGTSLATGDAVFPTVVDAAVRTATYVVPAVALAVTLGVLVGLYAALRPDGRLANASVDASYLAFALPSFWVGGILLSTTASSYWGYSPLVFEHVLPVVLVAATLLGGYVSYARAHAMEYVSAEFVTLVRAKGGSPRRVAAHVLRNAAIPVVSMLFTEALGLLVLAVFVVETVFGISGFGLLLVEAVEARDLPVIMGGTMVIIGVGVLANLLQDASYSVLDPRVDTGAR